MLHAGEGEAEATLHQGALFALILFARLDVDQFGAKIDYRKVVFEKLWQVERASPFVALLVKVDRADAVLASLEVGRDFDYVVVCTHVAE